MTYQRMIELLETEHECMLRKSHDVCDGNCCVCELVQDDYELHEMYINVISMLEEQEPRVMTLEAVRPIIEKNISTGECEDPWGRLFFCGACGKRINEKYNPDENDKYCKHCGRAVRWE